MTVQFQRALRVQVQGLVLQGLAVEFRVDRSLSANPNTAEITVYNLSPEHRAALQQLQKPIVQINAGYIGDDPTDGTNQPVSAAGTALPLIFLGQLRVVTNLRDGSDWITKISTGDGDKALKSPINFSLGPGTDIQTAVQKTIEQMGVGVGNAVSALKKGEFKEAGKQFASGFVAQGLGKTELDRLAKSAGLEYSVQNGDVQMMPRGQPTNNTAVLLTPTSGLIGSPEMGVDTRTQLPTVKFRSLLNARITPGSKVKLQTASILGFFRVNQAVYSGQTHGNDWFVDCECSALT